MYSQGFSASALCKGLAWMTFKSPFQPKAFCDSASWSSEYKTCPLQDPHSILYLWGELPKVLLLHLIVEFWYSLREGDWHRPPISIFTNYIALNMEKSSTLCDTAFCIFFSFLPLYWDFKSCNSKNSSIFLSLLSQQLDLLKIKQ